jgi:hypothetical protein
MERLRDGGSRLCALQPLGRARTAGSVDGDPRLQCGGLVIAWAASSLILPALRQRQTSALVGDFCMLPGRTDQILIRGRLRIFQHPEDIAESEAAQISRRPAPFG